MKTLLLVQDRLRVKLVLTEMGRHIKMGQLASTCYSWEGLTNLEGLNAKRPPVATKEGLGQQ
jgi:hypothetical protein